MRIKALLDDKVDLVNEVANLESKAWAAEEYVKEVRFAMDAEISYVLIYRTNTY